MKIYYILHFGTSGTLALNTILLELSPLVLCICKILILVLSSDLVFDLNDISYVNVF